MINFSRLNKITIIILGWLMLFSFQASAQTDYDSKPIEQNGINIIPLQDFSDLVIKKWQKNEIDLTKSFAVELEAKLTTDGRFDTPATRFTKIAGDEDIVNIIELGLVAIGDSGTLRILTDLDVENFTLTIVQNKEVFSARIVSTSDSPEKAKVRSSGFGGILSLAKIQMRSRIENLENGDIKKKENDRLFLLQNVRVSSNGNNLVLQMSLPQSNFQEIIKRNVLNGAEKREK